MFADVRLADEFERMRVSTRREQDACLRKVRAALGGLLMTLDDCSPKATEGLNAGRAFGPVIERDGCVIIPVAFVAGGGGGGDAVESTEGPPAPPAAASAGSRWPIGAYVIKDGNVRWVPAVDVTLIALGGLLVARTVLKVRARRRHPRGELGCAVAALASTAPRHSWSLRDEDDAADGLAALQVRVGGGGFRQRGRCGRRAPSTGRPRPR